MTYYAYLHARPNTENASGIFYVGKGNDKRTRKIPRKTNLHHTRIVNKYGEKNILIGKLPCSSESISFDLECGLIKCLKRQGVKLTNKTDGGEGALGYKHTPGQVLAMKLRLTGGKMSDSHKRKTSEASKKMWGTPGYKEAHSRKILEKWKDPEFRLKVSTKKKLTLANPEVRKAMSERAKLSLSDPKVRDKLRVAKNTLWMNKDGITIRAAAGEVNSLMLDGWIRGRK